MEEKIWTWLTGHGLTPEGAAGLMGNMYAESGLISNRLQSSGAKRLGMTDAQYTAAVDRGTYTNFARDGIGYGLCQWTYWSRKEGLLNHAKSRGKSVGDLETQLEYCLQELGTLHNGEILKVLQTTRSLREASDTVLTRYEASASQTEAVKAKRAAYGQVYLKFSKAAAAAAEKGAGMTETELRNKVCTTINGWMGATKGSATHRKILEIYNGYKPLARNYRMTVNDAWCATTVSATWIVCGIAGYTGTECSCSRFIEIAKSKGIWVESDSYMPKLGDAIVYDWEDSGSGDNTGQPNHIGIVTKISGTNFVVTEGNKSNKVATRSMKKNGRYIRGFITPDYASIARKLTGSGTTSSSTPSSTTQKEKPAFEPAQKRNDSYNRTWTVNSKSGLNLRWGAGTDYPILTSVPDGSKVRCYGYYSTSQHGNVWLCVVTGNLTGYMDKSYLK